MYSHRSYSLHSRKSQYSIVEAMKLRSHEILGTPTTPSSGSRFKQLFQGKKAIFKKNPPRSGALIHQIPGYVRKSIFRFLLEVKSTPHPSPSPISTPVSVAPAVTTKTVRPPPVMGIQALKTKKQQHVHHPISVKRSHRIKQQPITPPPPPPPPVIIDEFNQSIHSDNYDMTILHLNFDDDYEDSTFTKRTNNHQKKEIPQWAHKHELEIAICNQLYFHRNPSEIFGNPIDCSPNHLRTILHSMLPNVELFDDHQRPTMTN